MIICLFYLPKGLSALFPDYDSAKSFIRVMDIKFSKMGLHINLNKCKISPLTKSFKYCKATFFLTETGKVVCRGNRDSMKRARKKMRSFSKKVQSGEMAKEKVEELYKVQVSYFGNYNDHNRVLRLNRLYYNLFGGVVTMFRLYTVDDESIGVTEKLNYIRLHENGSLVLCEEKDAQGIAFNGEAYSFGGENGLEDKPIVRIEHTDTAVEIENTNNTTSIAFVTMAEAGSIDAVTAAEHADLFAEWTYPVAYKTGNIRRHGGVLYKCVQNHTSQADWEPGIAPTLWIQIADPTEEWPEWSAPIGAHDVYAEGDKVSHNDKHWVSSTNNNVWEPGVYGWTEEEPVEEE